MRKKILLFLGCFWVLLVGLAVHYFYTTMGTSANIYESVINSTFDTLASSLTNDSIFQKDNFRIDANIKLTSNIPDLESITKYNYSIALDSSTKDNKMALTLGLLEKDKSIMEAILYYIDGNGYLSLSDITRLFKIEMDSMNIEELDTSKFNSEDVLYLIESIKDYYLETFKEEDFTSVSEKIQIEGKSVSVTKVSYELNKDNIKEIVTHVLERMTSDEKFLDKLASVSDLPKEELKAGLADTLAQLKNDSEPEKCNADPMLGEKCAQQLEIDFPTIIINMYVQGKLNVRKVELITEDFKITYTKGDKKVITFTSEEKDVLVITIDKNELEVKLTIENTLVILTFKYEEKKNSIEGSIKLDITIDEENIGIEINYVVSSPAKIPDINVSNAVDISEITEQEINTIISKLPEEFGFLSYLVPSPTDNFASYANNALSAAEQAYYSELSTEGICFTVNYLVNNGYLDYNPAYKGSVYIDNSSYYSQIWLSDGSYYLYGTSVSWGIDADTLLQGSYTSENCSSMTPNIK